MAVLAAEHPPGDALALWMQRFVELASMKRGLAQALHSGDPAFDSLPVRREQRLRPAFRTLFSAAVDAGDIRSGVGADDFLNAAATLCMAVDEPQREQARQFVALLIAGLRCSAAEKSF